MACERIVSFAAGHANCFSEEAAGTARAAVVAAEARRDRTRMVLASGG